MRKITGVLLSVLLVGMVTACGSSKDACTVEGCKNELYKDGLCPDHYVEAQSGTDSNDTEQQDVAKDNDKEEKGKEKKEVQTITIGQTISTENYEATLNKVELSYDVQPENPPSYYNHYPAESGQVYVHVDMDIKNLQKQDMECDEIYSVVVDYNNGFTYKSFAVAEDTDGDFTYANITSVTPLQTMGVHALVDCPQEVETSSGLLYITITFMDGSQYKYVIR